MLIKADIAIAELLAGLRSGDQAKLAATIEKLRDNYGENSAVFKLVSFEAIKRFTAKDAA